MKRVLKRLARRFGLQITRTPQADHRIFREPAWYGLDLQNLKAFANRVAEFSASSGESEAVSNVYLTGLLNDRAPSEVCRIEIGNANTLQVGIWRKDRASVTASFVRRTDADRFEWANRDVIEPKRCKWRVAFIGESVARGYLYDPEFNPAAVLQHILHAKLRPENVDVVDLAKSSLSMQPLKDLIGQSLALMPDVIVIFAGNNWHQRLTEADIPYLDNLIRNDGVRGLKSLIDAKAEQSVTQLIRQANALVAGTDVRLIWVVPEFNLADWDDPEANVPLLSPEDSSLWRQLRKRADLALVQRDINSAIDAAKAMTSLDGGTSPVSARILADCYHLLGDSLAVRRAREQYRDASGWDPTFPYSPRTSAVIQNALRQAGGMPNNFVVDLPDVIGRHLDGALPGRRMFLDYCHLTAEGINVAMAGVASEVIATLTGQDAKQVSPGDFLFPSRDVEGKACFLAAIHNAHYYQGYAITRYWCERALEHWPQCADLMRGFLDFETRISPVMACKSGIAMFGRRELVTLMRGGKKRLDLVLCKAMMDALGEEGSLLEVQLEKLRAEEHSIQAGPKELTEFYYSSAVLGSEDCAWTSKSFPINRGQRSLYASAFWEKSKFLFFSAKEGAVTLKICFRIPGDTLCDATIAIGVNGHLLMNTAASGNWKTVEIAVPRECLVDGLNEVFIIWPDADDRSGAMLNQIADALLARRVPHFHRVFGEIHSLRVSDSSCVTDVAKRTAVASNV
jgi:hypothetical protein